MRVETARGAMAVDGLGTTLMHEHVLPALREHGVDEAQITAMLVHNPARYFTGGQE
jgi:predicted metal-dependent phosphotriesterase family hydrolase